MDEIKYKKIIYSIGILLISAMAMNLLTVTVLIILEKTILNSVLNVFIDIAILLSVGVLPVTIYVKYLHIPVTAPVNCVRMLIGYILIFAVLSLKFPLIYVFHFSIIAIAEEIHFRGVQYEYLKKQYGIIKTVIITSLLFAFLLHLNDGVMSNLLIRFPLGLVLGLIRYRFGINECILFHWVYDLIAVFIL